MRQHFDSRSSLQGTKRKKRTKSAPSPQELAKQYFDLQCLRQQVRIAGSEQIVDRELTGSPGKASFA